MTVEILNGRRVGVSRIGKGQPMLILHPALAHRGAMQGLMAGLDGFNFTTFDLPGHGESEFDERLDIQLQACENAIALLAQADQPSDIFGHSFGATVALKVALMRPDLVRSLSLYEPVYFSLLAKANPDAYATEMEASTAFRFAAKAQDWPNASRAFLSRWSIGSFDNLPAAQQKYIMQTIPLIVASTASIVDPVNGALILAQLPQLAQPVLLMEGEHSPAATSHICAVISEYCQTARTVKIDGVSHMGPITHSAKIANIVKQFLGDTSA